MSWTIAPGEADAIFDRIDADANQALLVAESDLRVIGTLVLVVVQNLAHRGQPWAVVENVAVSESVRGQGIGTLLIEEAVRRARGARCYKLVLSAHQSRADAHASTASSASRRPTSASSCSSFEAMSNEQ